MPSTQAVETGTSELLALLLGQGLLRRSETQPVLSRDGTSARWMLDSLQVSLMERGARLAGQALLKLLNRFEGTQIATYGLNGTPLLHSCLQQGGGKYRGLLVRKDRKPYGSTKLIEGHLDPAEPVVIVDDSISSGTAMFEACERLESAGLRVEGGVFLVRFGWYGGVARARERGYHVESVFDVWDDLIPLMADEDPILPNPSKWFPETASTPHRLPEGLHPCHLARMVMVEYLRHGSVARPPERLDRPYDSSGGAWVSMRSRSNIHVRHARDGFWHFPGETAWTTPEGVARAALRTACHLTPGDESLQMLDQSSLAVTLFSALEQCTVGELDNSRYGIVVRSLERQQRMGGALPCMPGIRNEWEQFQHARRNNAELVSFEPYVVYRHDVRKILEPGAEWQPTGVPAAADGPIFEDPVFGTAVAVAARTYAESVLSGIGTLGELDVPSIAPDGTLLYVTIYTDGRIRGCMGCVVSDLRRNIRELVDAALEDPRFADDEREPHGRLAVMTSWLYCPLTLGVMSDDDVVGRHRFGEQALMAFDGENGGFLLPWFAARNDWTEREYIAQVRSKAGIPEQPCGWQRFDVRTWCADRDTARPVRGAFKDAPAERTTPALVRRLRTLTLSYLVRNQRPDGRFFFRYRPAENTLSGDSDLPRMAHGAWVLARAARAGERDVTDQVVDRSLQRLLALVAEDDDGVWLCGSEGAASVSEIAFLLLSASELTPEGSHSRLWPSLADALWSRINLHGRIQCHRTPADEADCYQDYYPGQVALALAAAAHRGFATPRLELIQVCRRYYRHRFRYKQDFGQASWWAQASAAWYAITSDREWAAFALEIGNSLLPNQSNRSGGFLSDSPGDSTTLFLEAVGAAIRTAEAIGDGQARDRFLDAWCRGLSFLEGLVYQSRDGSLLPNPAFAIGGLRLSDTTTEVRTDFVQHLASALLDSPAFL
jgi:orotate phosphoribosyltransferase/AMMECR1 domain-containing protein